MNKTNFKRVLLKISGESLMGVGSYGIDVSTVDRVAKEIAQVCKLGIEICLVIGAGNIFRGLSGAAAGMDRASADYMGMLATVMNSLAMQNSLERLNVQTRVQSAISMTEVCETYTRRRAIRHMEKNRIVILRQEQETLILLLIPLLLCGQVKWIVKQFLKVRWLMEYMIRTQKSIRMQKNFNQ